MSLPVRLKKKKDAPPSEYAKALAKGNILSCLPLELRQEVFAFAALHYVNTSKKGGMVEAADISERVHEWLPPMCHVNDDFFLESLPMFLRHVNIIVREAYTAYNLYFFLQATGMFSYIYSLRYADAGTLAPSFAGPQLLKQCNNIRHVWFSFKPADFPSIHRHSQVPRPFVLDKKAFLENHSFRQLLTLKHCEKVTIFIVLDRTRMQYRDAEEERTCYGIVGWLEKKFRSRNLTVEVTTKRGMELEFSR